MRMKRKFENNPNIWISYEMDKKSNDRYFSDPGTEQGQKIEDKVKAFLKEKDLTGEKRRRLPIDQFLNLYQEITDQLDEVYLSVETDDLLEPKGCGYRITLWSSRPMLRHSVGTVFQWMANAIIESDDGNLNKLEEELATWKDVKVEKFENGAREIGHLYFVKHPNFGSYK